MPVLTVNKTYDDGQVLTEQQLDDAFNSIADFINVTKLGTDNIQPGAIDETLIATNGVGTTELQDGSVTTPKLADSAVTTAKIADANVTTSKLADGSVTQAKIAPKLFAQSGGSGVVSYGAASGGNALSLVVAAPGTRLLIQLVPDYPGVSSLAKGVIVSNQMTSPVISILRGATVVASWKLLGNPSGVVECASGGFFAYDTPSAGAETYALFMQGGTGTAIQMYDCKLVVSEV